MIVYIPLAIGQSLHDSVKDSINQQSLKCETVVISTCGYLPDAHSKEEREKKLTGIMQSRNKIIDEFLQTEDRFCIIQDRDIVHLNNDNFKNALHIIESNDDIGAVYISGIVKPNHTHYNLQCAMFRREAFKDFRFRWDDRLHGCECASEDLIKNGWKLSMNLQINKLIRVINYAQ